MSRPAPVPMVATARRKGRREKTNAKVRLVAPDGLMIQCPRDWRADLAPGTQYRVAVTMRADKACYVAHPGQGCEAV